MTLLILLVLAIGAFLYYGISVVDKSGFTDSADVFTFTIRRYKDSNNVSSRSLGKGRYAIDLGKSALVFEFWWMR